MFMALVCLGCTFPLITPSAIALSVCNGVGGCTQPSSSSMILMYTALQAIMHRPASSALVAEDRTFFYDMCYRCSVLPHCLVGQWYCLKGISAIPPSVVLLSCLSSWHCCVLLTPYRLRGRRVQHLPVWLDNWGVEGLLHCVFSWFGWLGCYGADWAKKGAINCSAKE